MNQCNFRCKLSVPTFSGLIPDIGIVTFSSLPTPKWLLTSPRLLQTGTVLVVLSLGVKEMETTHLQLVPRMHNASDSFTMWYAGRGIALASIIYNLQMSK
jgi:hypothetical protein